MEVLMAVMCGFLVVLLEFLLVWGGHYLPWRLFAGLVDDCGDLHRPCAYAYGCAAIWIVYAGWRVWLSSGNALIDVVMLFTLILAAGAGAILPRLLAALLEMRALREDLGDYESAIQA
jgi:hypothetical protein